MPRRPVELAGARLEKSRHVCAFFHSPDEEYRVLLPFIKDGIQKKEKAYHIVDPAQRQDHCQRLSTAGIDCAAAEASGQLEVRVWQDAYLKEGHFDQDRMLQLIQDVLNGGKAAGYPLTRLVAHMEWALEDRPGVNDLVEYETRLNYILPKYDDPVV